MLRANLRDLRTEAGEHYADILLSLYQRQLKELHEEQEADKVEAEAIKLAIQTNKQDQPVNHINGGEIPHEAVRGAGGTGNSKGSNGTGTAGQVDKSALPISSPRRVRFVASQPCLVCGHRATHTMCALPSPELWAAR